MNAKVRAELLLPLLLALGPGALGCHGVAPGAPHVGAVNLAVQMKPTIDIETIAYRVSGNGILPRTGSISLASGGGTASLLVAALPGGPGYLVELDGSSRDGATACSGSATFAVIAARTSHVTVVLQCRTASGRGGAVITGHFNNCPVLTAYSASPLATDVGDSVTLTAAASDADAADLLHFTWSGNGGVFSDAGEAQTTFRCELPGTHEIRLTVTDGGCSTSTTFAVTCALPGADEPDAGTADSAADGLPPDGAAAACGLTSLSELDGAVFTIVGTQTISRISRGTGVGECHSARVSVPVSTRGRLSLHEGLWLFSYEGPYNPVTIPSAPSSPAPPLQTLSPHSPFVHPADPNRKGIPLVASLGADGLVELSAGSAAKELFPSGVSYAVPLCTDYVFIGSIDDFDASFSGLRLSISLVTGRVQVSHTCGVHHAVSGCPQPTVADFLEASGALVCDDA